MAKKEDVKTNSPSLNQCCADCMKWEQFGKECWSHWHGKKECSQKVENQDEWDYEKLVLKE